VEMRWTTTPTSGRARAEQGRRLDVKAAGAAACRAVRQALPQHAIR
jgi:hypothetical protein